MKENKYDNDVFFGKYSQMDRSKKGLDGAGEWENLEKILPDFENKRVLDLGCGYGWHCVYAIENKASHVVGVDISNKMLNVAKEKTAFTDKVEYVCAAMEDICFEKECFDIVICSLALHYVKSFEEIAKKIQQYLAKDGIFVFSVEHPIFTAYGSQDWYFDSDGTILHFPVDNYFYEGERKANFLGEEVTKYHKTLTTYLNGLLQNGFEILHIVEPTPSQKQIEEVEGMKDELRRPMMLLISAQRK